MRYCVVGLGYVGLTLAVHIANKGFLVEGVDTSDEVIKSLTLGRAHFYEHNFDTEVLKALNSGNLRFSKLIHDYEGETVFIVTVGTPLGHNEKVNLEPIKSVSKNISAALNYGDTIILRSTVRLGVTRNVVKPLLDASQKNYYLGFCPERTVEGKALEELETLPQIISGIDQNSTERVNRIFSQVSRETVVMNSVEEAEIVKLLNNSERDLTFAIANEIALMCDATGMDAHKIIAAANYNYPRASLKRPGPVGGPCLEKDPYILTEGFLDASYTPSIFLSGRKVNEKIIRSTFELFANEYESRTGDLPKTIAILGMAFKGVPPTGDMRGSLVYDLVDVIRERYKNVEIIGHDYLANESDIEGASCTYKPDVATALIHADMVVLQNNHPEYAKERWNKILQKDTFVLDFWNQLSTSSLVDTSRYYRFGAMKSI